MKKYLMFLLTLTLLTATNRLPAQGTAFTYQGQLQYNGSPANGTYNLTFSLYNTNSGGASVAGPVTNNDVVVTNGLFAVAIDFGPNVFAGQSNWLQIGVATNGVNTFTTLAPRQELTPAPYAIYAEGANATGLIGTIPAANFGGSYNNTVSFNNGADSFDGSFYGLFYGASFIGGIFTGDFLGNGSGLTGLGASAISGTISPTNLPFNALNYWVATNGSDTNKGSWFNPFLTISNAVSVAQAGSVVSVLPGLYPNWGNLAKEGVTLQFYGPSCIVSNYATNAISNSTNAIFSTAGGTTHFSVLGYPTLIYNTGLDFYGSTNKHGIPTFIGASNSASAIYINNAAAAGILQIDNIQFSSYQNALLDIAPVMLLNCSNINITVNYISNLTAYTTYCYTNGSRSQCYAEDGGLTEGVLFGGGRVFFTGRWIDYFPYGSIREQENYAAYSYPTTNIVHWNVDQIDGFICVTASDRYYESYFNTAFINSTNATSAATFSGGSTWLTAQRILEPDGGTVFLSGGGQLVANIGSLDCPGDYITTFSDSDAHGALNALYATVINFAGAAAGNISGNISLAGATNYVNAPQYHSP
jgi:hypothetical protein